MNISPHTTLLCPHCYRDFRVAAWRVTAGNTVSCTGCNGTIVIDAALPEFRLAINTALHVSDQFYGRSTAYRPQSLAASPGQPMRDRLDDLARQLDALSRG